MSRRKALQDLSKPAIVLRNAYKSAASDRTVELTKDIKIGDHLAAVGDTEATITWKNFTFSVAEKFADKHFSRSILWLSCLKENINPLHVIQAISDLRKDERRAAPPLVDLCIYKDVEADREDLKEDFRKLDKVVSISLEFKAPYEKSAWFPIQKIQNLAEVLHFTIAPHVGTTDKLFERFSAYSENAKAFCLRHIENIVEHSEGKEQANLLTRLMDSLANPALTRDSNQQLKLNGIDIVDNFEACLALISEKAKSSPDDELYGYGFHIGKFINQTYLDPQEFERVASALGKTGVNGMTRSLGQEVLKDPGRFMPLAVAVGKNDARRLFALVALYTPAMNPEETLSLVDEYDRWYTNMGLGTLLKPDALWTLTHNIDTVELLHQRGLVDYPAMAKVEGFNHSDFCDRKSKLHKSFLTDRSEIERFVKLCAEVGAQDHLMHFAEEDLVKGKFDKRLADESLRKDFFEVLLETKAVDPDVLLRTPKRIEKMIELGVSPRALQSSKKYSSKWQDNSFGSDLGL